MTTLTIRSLNSLALGNLRQYRSRTLLSALAVALGVAMIVANDVIGGALRSAMMGEGSQSMLGMIVGLSDTMLGGVGIVMMAVAGFLVFNAFAMSVTQRRQQIGALRCLGMTRRQIIRLTVTEALVTGIAGTITGLIVGPLLGKAITGLMQAVGGQIFAFGQSDASLTSMVTAAALGLGVTVLAVVIPAWSASHVPPLAALRAPEAAGVDAIPLRRTAAGLLIITVMLVILIVAPPAQWARYPWDNIVLGLFEAAWLICLGLVLSALVGGVGRWIQPTFSRRWGATGRLVSDNVQRGRRRVMLTVLTLATGLAMIVGLTGAMSFMFKQLLFPTMEQAIRYNVQILAPFNIRNGVAGIAGKRLSDLSVPPEAMDDLRHTFDGQADTAGIYVAFPPELSALMPGLFSYIIDAHALRQLGNSFFTFSEGDWDSAMPALTSKCGLLIAPTVARVHNVGVGDRLTITSPDGPLDCTVAGTGMSVAGISLISGTVVSGAFHTGEPMIALLLPHADTDTAQIKAEFDALSGRHPGLYPTEVETVMQFNMGAADAMVGAMNGILLLAILGAALGVVNTTVISVSERRQELGLLRAVGCSRRQVRTIVAGEAALMGLIGAALGVLAGVGVTVIFVLVVGGQGVGLSLPLWPTAWLSVQSALITGIVGLIAAPFIAAGAAWLPARSILRGAPVETLTQRL
jgi:putative ABC transport system permease protein